jgi:uncharacterized protein
MAERRRVQFVIKVSKFCNLRCRYCYEYDHLSDKTRMSRENLERLYTNVASFYRKLDTPPEVEFVWHGGEPLLQSPSYYYETLSDQRRIFDDRAHKLRNVVQTNLTILDDERIELLRTAFDGIGVSIDLFGGLRVNAGGDDSVKKALPNLDRLRKEKIDFGCITVLTKANLGSVRKIVRFYDKLRITPVRFLPLFDGPLENQHKEYEITHEEVLFAFKEIFEELLLLDSPIRVEPIHRYVNQVVHQHTPGSLTSKYDKRDWEPVYVVDINGDLYSYAETYDPSFLHGNLFTTPLEDIVLGPGHTRAISAAEARMAQTCEKCRHYGHCDGYPIAEGAGRHRKTQGAELECVVEQGMLGYLEQRLTELGVINPVTGVALPRPRPALRHIDKLPLQTQVKIHFRHDKGDPSERLSLSSGTQQQFEPPGDGLSYLSAAFVPREPWRAPTAAEKKALIASSPQGEWNLASDVGVFRIPDDVLLPMEKIFEDFGTRERLDADQYRVHTNHPDWDAAYDRLISHLKRQYALHEHGPTVVRLATAPPGMKTLTKDEVRGQAERFYVGLHLDTWEKVPFRERDQAKNRICVNLGREDRYFLFMNLTLMKMYEALKNDGAANRDDYYGTDLGHEFMQAFPGYPVLRLKLRPREAYIAPTDNLIHDASSVGKKYPDIALHILGYFGFSPERVVSLPMVRSSVEA